MSRIAGNDRSRVGSCGGCVGWVGWKRARGSDLPIGEEPSGGMRWRRGGWGLGVLVQEVAERLGGAGRGWPV